MHRGAVLVLYIYDAGGRVRNLAQRYGVAHLDGVLLGGRHGHAVNGFSKRNGKRLRGRIARQRARYGTRARVEREARGELTSRNCPRERPGIAVCWDAGARLERRGVAQALHGARQGLGGNGGCHALIVEIPHLNGVVGEVVELTVYVQPQHRKVHAWLQRAGFGTKPIPEPYAVDGKDCRLLTNVWRKAPCRSIGASG